MKDLKDNKISIVLFGLALLVFGVSFVTGLIPEMDFAIDKICMYLGFSLFGFGLIFMTKNMKNNNMDNK